MVMHGADTLLIEQFVGKPCRIVARIAHTIAKVGVCFVHSVDFDQCSNSFGKRNIYRNIFALFVEALDRFEHFHERNGAKPIEIKEATKTLVNLIGSKSEKNFNTFAVGRGSMRTVILHAFSFHFLGHCS